MARNLVEKVIKKMKEEIKEDELEDEKESTEETEEINNKPIAIPKEKKESEVRVITQEQFIINHLEFLIGFQQELYSKMMEGFKQVGVKFEDIKE